MCIKFKLKMDWLHCNKCFTQDSQIELYMTNCGHFFCKLCLNNALDYCQVCESSCRYILLQSDIQPELQYIFKDDETEIDLFSQGFKLRNQHRINLLHYFQKEYMLVKQNFQNLANKYEHVKRLYTNSERKLKEARNHIDLLHEENQKLKTTLKQSEVQIASPISGGAKSYHSNNSLKRNPQIFPRSKEATNMSVVSGSNKSNTPSLGGFGTLYPKWKKRLNN